MEFHLSLKSPLNCWLWSLRDLLYTYRNEMHWLRPIAVQACLIQASHTKQGTLAITPCMHHVTHAINQADLLNATHAGYNCWLTPAELHALSPKTYFLRERPQ